ncbi:uncharacterized protein LOC111437179 [Cucurbita moschata]|uniref:Uncharacterized protein LOC111437179 n=1 Tax=Cucurbita moschata TaxID=3662 RepID=A0A6J1EWF9_CUCMO|nr:uncharacterized protein LOC111437179 [Cucurbita moschata]
MVSLRNLMEEKQLDFGQPLLSVRRFTSTGTPPETHEKTRPEPKIPPLPVCKSELKSGPVRNPGTVPFVWEQTPGKPKDEGTTTTQISKRPPLVPKLPPGRTRKVNQEVPTPIDDSLGKNDRETVEEMASCKSRNDDDDEEDDDDDDEVYRDANDRFYRSESFFLNCSFSGVSGLDGSEIQPPAASSMDPHARNFMLDRFLPAAKAMASETLPHTNRKLTVPIEQSSEIKTITNGNRQSRPNVHVQRKHVKEIFMEESEDEDDDYDESGYTSARGCGFLPRFCLKGSFFPLNPVPGMRMQATSVRRIRNSSIKSSKDAVNEKRSSHGQGITRTRLQPEEKSSKSNMQEGKIFSLYSHLQGEGESNYADEPSRAVHTNVSLSRGFTEKAINSVTDGYDEPHRRSLNSFQALLSDESGSSSPVEKTLYIDSVHKMKSPDSSSNSLDMKGISAKLTSSELANNKKFDLDNQYSFKPSKQSDSNSREYSNKHEFDSKKLIETDIHESFDGPARDSPDLRTSEDATNGKKDSKHRHGSHGGYSQSRLSFAPPPPKSPSDSWLKRTLPPSKNASFLQSSLAMRLNPVSTTVSPDPIEESTVKSSDSNRLHLQFSKELLSSIPEV